MRDTNSYKSGSDPLPLYRKVCKQEYLGNHYLRYICDGEAQGDFYSHQFDRCLTANINATNTIGF